MLLMQIVSSLIRQWRLCDLIERVLVVCFVSGLVVSLIASTFDGAVLVAAAFGLFVLYRTGLLASPYQKAVGRALKPFYSLRVEERERDSSLLGFAGELATVRPPYVLHDEHSGLLRTLQRLIEARESYLVHRDMSRYAVAVITLRNETDKWLQRNSEEKNDGDNGGSYVHEVRDAISAYYAKEDAIAAQRHRVFSSAITNLQKIMPPARRSRAHRDLIETVRRVDKLTTRQRVCLSEADELGVVSTAAELAASRTSMEDAIRQVRSLR